MYFVKSAGFHEIHQISHEIRRTSLKSGNMSFWLITKYRSFDNERPKRKERKERHAKVKKKRAKHRINVSVRMTNFQFLAHWPAKPMDLSYHK